VIASFHGHRDDRSGRRVGPRLSNPRPLSPRRFEQHSLGGPTLDRPLSSDVNEVYVAGVGLAIAAIVGAGHACSGLVGSGQSPPVTSPWLIAPRMHLVRLPMCSPIVTAVSPRRSALPSRSHGPARNVAAATPSAVVSHRFCRRRARLASSVIKEDVAAVGSLASASTSPTRSLKRRPCSSMSLERGRDENRCPRPGRSAGSVPRDAAGVNVVGLVALLVCPPHRVRARGGTKRRSPMSRFRQAIVPRRSSGTSPARRSVPRTREAANRR